MSTGTPQAHAATATVDQQNFKALERSLERLLQRDETPDDARDLAKLVARQPIEQEPLPLLGTTPDEADVAARLAILKRVHPALKRLLARLGIEAGLLAEAFEIYIPLARFMLARGREIRARHGRAAVFGLSGAQGSGKTTINAILQLILAEGFDARVAGFSIDDVYKTFDERQEMARRVHPLFAIRGVAGTHDVALAKQTITALMRAEAGDTVAIPRFDKAAKAGAGDRLPPALWPIVEGPLDLLVFEGWCVGAVPQDDSALAAPVNGREARDDADGIWRHAMNRLLATDYRDLFVLIDELMFIEVGGMQDVYRNREKQEQKLRFQLEEARARGEDMSGRGAMSPAEVIDFIGLYERTTAHMLSTLPDEARLTLTIGAQHRIEKLRVRAPETAGRPA